jgi:hypothetical protein
MTTTEQGVSLRHEIVGGHPRRRTSPQVRPGMRAIRWCVSVYTTACPLARW